MTKTANNHKNKSKGIRIKRFFTQPGKNVYDSFSYENRKSSIRNPTGELVFEMQNIEVPKGWSQVATDILAQKYFRKTGVTEKHGGKGGAEHSAKQVVHRMANCWRAWGEKYGYFNSKADADAFYEEIAYSLLNQMAAPNSPQWFNTGLHSSYGIKGASQGHYYTDPETETLKTSGSAYERPQTHACFILSVEDDLVNEGGIMDLMVKEARIFKYGSGAGTNYSRIRSVNEKLSGGGYSSGLMSFLKVSDRAAGAIKSGGTTRRAAKMVCIDLDHPEVSDLINWKPEEEKKVAALVAAGYSADYEGEAYQTVSGQNANISVRIPDSFFRALHNSEDWELKSRSTGECTDKIKASELWSQIASAAWKCGDPGVQFDTTINQWHTCPEGGPIKASNPCSEYMFLDNTGCNLASINLRKFWNETTNEFQVENFQHVCKLWTIVLEITTLMAQYPTKEIAQLSYEYRPVGLGFANLGGLLMSAGIPYDSDQGRAVAGAITSIMTGSAYKTSAEIASVLGPFKRYEENKKHMLRVLRNHRAASYASKTFEGLSITPMAIDNNYCPDYLLKASRQVWDEALESGQEYGFRNAQATVLAPTGTIGLLMDCDTTGIEPDFALVKFKKLSGGGYFKIINSAVPAALKSLGYSKAEADAIITYATGSASFTKAPHINKETLLQKGFTLEEISTLEASLKSAFHLNFVFTSSMLGASCMDRLGFDKAIYQKPDFNLLQALGFTNKQIEEANNFICGTMTLEGAPYLKKEHLPVFDCANKCGNKGTRFLQPKAHIKMMAAAQAFITGAISKTINFPNEATEDEIKENLELCWKLGLKACTVYRDGSKMSQPLSTSSDKKEDSAKEEAKTEEKQTLEPLLVDNLTPEIVLEAAHKILSESDDTKFKQQLSRVMVRKTLPDKRGGFTQKAKIGGHAVFIRTGEYEDGTLGEIFIDMYKEGASYRSLLNCFAIAVSVGLQYGVPLEEYVDKFTFTRFEPSGSVEGQPYIKFATSLPDFIFRMLAWEYLDRKDLLHIEPDKAPSNNGATAKAKLSPQVLKPANIPEKAETAADQTQEYLSSMMGDAPICDVCGHITIRNGTCYKCLNCGNSLGCS
ncbi:vitamin B12-dependent ribonucleotide reductase [Cytophagaceae bacterium ABcell3]|nr:vitamin B12-dependent ribonucleotide reductase [Cytophagaceae bacterium ABcell3]